MNEKLYPGQAPNLEKVKTDLEELGIEAPHSLYNYLSRLTRHTGKEVTSPFSQGETSSSLLDHYDVMADNFKYYESLSRLGVETENGERELFKVQSDVPPMVVEDVIAEIVDHKQQWTNIPFNRIWRIMNDIFFNGSRPQLSVVSVETANDAIVKNTNSGLPWFTRRSLVQSQASARAHTVLRTLKDPSSQPSLDYDNTTYPDLFAFVIGGRAKPKPEGTKRRIIYMANYTANIIEKMVSIPLVEALSKSTIMPYKGPEAMHLRVSELLATGRNFQSFDVSSFDRNVVWVQILTIQNLVRSWFRKDSWPIIDQAFAHNLKAHIITPWGVIRKPNGVLSGWGLTNLVDSLLNVWHRIQTLLYFGMSDEATRRIIGNSVVNGDDMVVEIGDIDPDILSEAYQELYGWNVHAQKQWVSSSEAIFSGHLYHRKGHRTEYYRPFWRFLRGFYFPERDHRVGSLGESLIALSKLHTFETSHMFNPVMQDIITRDVKHGLGTFSKDTLSAMTAPSVMKRVKDSLGIDRADEVPLNTTLRGIKSWKVYQYIAQR